jgi:hypothetical protein
MLDGQQRLRRRDVPEMAQSAPGRYAGRRRSPARLAWEKAPPGSAAPKTAQTYEERHTQETAAMVESFRRMGLTLQLGSDTTGLLESEVES